MKRIALIFAALFLTVPLFAADAARDGSGSVAEREFPRVSKFQERRPVRVATQEDAAMCGYHPSLPPNCFYKCRDGVPVSNPDGTQRVMCYNEPYYPSGEESYCNFYYACVPYQNSIGKTCAYTGSLAATCTIAFSTCGTCAP